MMQQAQPKSAATRAGCHDRPFVEPAYSQVWNIALYQLDASGGNLLIARDAGGWASVTVVDETYGHADIHDPAFGAALAKVWGEPQ